MSDRPPNPDPIILTDELANDLRELRDRAVADPFDVRRMPREIRHKAKRLKLAKRIEALSLVVYATCELKVTYNIEVGQPVGTCRHLTMSVQCCGRVPTHDEVWRIADRLGFVFGLEACVCWEERFGTSFPAVNVLQPVTLDAKWINDVASGGFDLRHIATAT